MSLYFNGAVDEIVIDPDFAPVIEIEGRSTVLINRVLLEGSSTVQSSLAGSLTVTP